MNLSATHAVSVNPTTGEVVSLAAVGQRTRGRRGHRARRGGLSPVASDAACRPRRRPAPHRAALRARGEEVAQMITLEMGKPIAQARGEVAKSANLCDWYAEHGPAMLATEATLVENNQAVIEYRPLGAILAVMPWNFPVWQVMRRRGADPAGRQQLSAEACPERDGQRPSAGRNFCRRPACRMVYLVG